MLCLRFSTNFRVWKMANLANIAMLAELDGAILVDKPVGISAHDVMKAVKSSFNLVKVGHGGTLDVAATGLFVLLLGDATRFSNDLMGADRAYSVTIALGRETDTSDRVGNVLSEKPFEDVARERFDAALKELRGDIYQSPPEFSAVKIPGKTGYEIVRTAEGNELREKLVHVYRYDVTEFAPPKVSIAMKVAKGVSVRALVRDLGRELGCGASVEDNRRTLQGVHSVDDAIPFMKLMEMHPADLAARLIPKNRILSR
jgi:tRNA pseudouridine55 synthase